MKTSRSDGKRVLLVGTAKGAFLFTGDSARKRWKLDGPFFLGQRVHDFRADPRDGKTLLLSATGGHLGPTIYRSSNRGKSWSEAKQPPQFGALPRGKSPAAVTGSRGNSVKINFFLAPAHASEAGVWYCGTSPSGLFRSDDGGATWKGVAGFNDRPTWWEWTGGGKFASPEGALLHSILVDPRDAEHLFVSLSAGGTFESFDGGRHWKPLNKGVLADFSPDKYPEFGQDPHCMIQHPGDPDRLYQQNHCGIYRLERAQTDEWVRIGKNMPKAIGDIGFPVVPHPSDADTVWVFPMDGTQLWPRTSPGAKPAVYRTRDGGKRWERLDAGLPRSNAWFTVFRQAMDADDDERNTGLYFGTTSGGLWGSRDGGESWSVLAEHLPRILSVRVARLGSSRFGRSRFGPPR
jgi:photosystem II stability/assembly factor-like uncharacterized protein